MFYVSVPLVSEITLRRLFILVSQIQPRGPNRDESVQTAINSLIPFILIDPLHISSPLNVNRIYDDDELNISLRDINIEELSKATISNLKSSVKDGAVTAKFEIKIPKLIVSATGDTTTLSGNIIANLQLITLKVILKGEFVRIGKEIYIQFNDNEVRPKLEAIKIDVSESISIDPRSKLEIP